MPRLPRVHVAPWGFAIVAFIGVVVGLTITLVREVTYIIYFG